MNTHTSNIAGMSQLNQTHQVLKTSVADNNNKMNQEFMKLHSRTPLGVHSTNLAASKTFKNNNLMVNTTN